MLIPKIVLKMTKQKYYNDLKIRDYNYNKLSKKKKNYNCLNVVNSKTHVTSSLKPTIDYISLYNAKLIMFINAIIGFIQ